MECLFKELHERFLQTALPIDKWKDRYGVTMLMMMVISSDDTSTFWCRHMNLLVEIVIRKEYFDDKYINQKVGSEQSQHFDLQHCQGQCKENKQKCTCLKLKQEIPMKTVGKEIDGKIEKTFGQMKEGQEKRISKNKVGLVGKEDRRIMVTGVPCNENKNFKGEHFDTDSLHTVSSKTYKANFNGKENIYKVLESIDTNILSTPREKISKLVFTNTTLSHLVCKTKSWDVMKAILDLDPAKYPILFSKEGLYKLDDSKAHCLFLAIEDGQLDICKMMIEKIIDIDTIKSMLIVDSKDVKKNVKALVSDMLNKKSSNVDCDENLMKQKDLEELLECINQRIRNAPRKKKCTKKGQKKEDNVCIDDRNVSSCDSGNKVPDCNHQVRDDSHEVVSQNLNLKNDIEDEITAL